MNGTWRRRPEFESLRSPRVSWGRNSSAADATLRVVGGQRRVACWPGSPDHDVNAVPRVHALAAGRSPPARARRSEELAAVVEHPSLQEEFEQWQGRVPSVWEDPYHPRELTWIARERGIPVAFAFCYVLPSTPGRFAQVRLGVLASHRRRRLGSHLLETAIAALRSHAPDCREISLIAWVPNVAAEAFAVRHRFTHARWFWL
ncbi:MAG: GNAT family N-acetyltransferase, partial [Candidatus Eisenbacteria bacterium]